MESLLEQQRKAHEEIERVEQVIVNEYRNAPKNVHFFLLSYFFHITLIYFHIFFDIFRLILINFDIFSLIIEEKNTKSYFSFFC